MLTMLPVSLTEMAADVHELNPQNLPSFAARHRKAMVLMYEGSCTATAAFQPWLYALAQMIPGLPMGQLDVSGKAGAPIKSAFNVTATPIVKVFSRDNVKGERIIDYLGPLEFDSLYNWSSTMRAGNSHSLSAFGAEPPETPAMPLNGGSVRGGNAFDKLPAEVRKMASTMVRESRLQRMLKQQGQGRLEQYDRMVSRRYHEIMRQAETDLSDKYGVQEANRRARDEIREEILESAPAHIREEVEADVSMGDLAGVSGP